MFYILSMALYQSRIWLHSHFYQLFLSAVMVVLVIFGGTVGYYFLEGWSVIDSFYMTIITLSTVGFREVEPLSPGGKLFTSGLIFAGVGVVLYSGTAVAQSIIEGEIQQYRGFHKMQKQIGAVANHVIVCGYGRLASIVCEEMMKKNQSVVVIENDSAKIDIIDAKNIHYVEGNAYDDDVLKAAGIERAQTLLALLTRDSDNVYIALCAKDLNPNITVVARSEHESGENKLLRAGADRVISPYRLSGNRIVQQLVRPNVMDFLEVASLSSENRLVLEEVVVPVDSPLGGKTLEESELRDKTGVIIAAFINPDGEMEFNPGRLSVIEPGMTLIVLGENQSLAKLEAIISK